MIRGSGRTLIVGVLNVTPDSFSDGGLYYKNVPRAVAYAARMATDGADIIDVGGESTRPGSEPVSPREQLVRVLPVIRGIRKKLGRKVVISVDTNLASVAREALREGAGIVNSLGGFIFDPALANVVADAGCRVAIYHVKGEPKTMQKGRIVYRNVVKDIGDFFREQMKFGARHGIRKERFILDPGIGFGKTVEHNLQIVKNCGAFTRFGVPVMIGVSRKSHLGMILRDELRLPAPPPPVDRVEAGLAEIAVAVMQGVRIVRTHDVLPTKKFLAVFEKLL